MIDNQQREGLFTLIKQAMKTKGMTYATLAIELEVSEVSVKRLFRDKDCKLSRLLSLCRAIDINLDDLLQMQQRITQTPKYLPVATERALAAEPNLFTLLILLTASLDTHLIQASWGVDQPTLYLHLRKLEQLHLIEIAHDNSVHFCIPLPIRWRVGGALSSIIKQANQRYISYCIDREADPAYTFMTGSRLISQHSIESIERQLDDVAQQWNYLATQDQMFYPHDELKLYKLVYGMGPFPIEKIFPLQ